MGKSSLRLDTRRALKDGSYPVQVKVGYGKNLYLSTGVYLEKEEWDEGLQICKGRQSRSVNNILRTLLTSVSNRILELKESGQWERLTTAQLREMLTNMALTSPTVGVPTFGEYLDKVSSLKKDHTRASYETTKNRLAGYCDVNTLRFSDMSYAWFEAFAKRLQDDGLKQTTIAKYFKVVKYVVKLDYLIRKLKKVIRL